MLEETEDENRPRCKKDVVKRQEERIVYRLQVMKKTISIPFNEEQQKKVKPE